MEFLTNKFFLIALTFIVFLCSQWLQKRTGMVLLNPILIAIIVLISYLLIFDID